MLLGALSLSRDAAEAVKAATWLLSNAPSMRRTDLFPIRDNLAAASTSAKDKLGPSSDIPISLTARPVLALSHSSPSKFCAIANPSRHLLTYHARWVASSLCSLAQCAAPPCQISHMPKWTITWYRTMVPVPHKSFLMYGPSMNPATSAQSCTALPRSTHLLLATTPIAS